jgi:hypothetical protein
LRFTSFRGVGCAEGFDGEQAQQQGVLGQQGGQGVAGEALEQPEDLPGVG